MHRYMLVENTDGTPEGLRVLAETDNISTHVPAFSEYMRVELHHHLSEPMPRPLLHPADMRLSEAE